MRRVVVVGNPGSGKSVVADHIARTLRLRWVEADALLWGPRWSKIPHHLYAARLAALTSGDGWVAEGVYPEVLALAARADLVVWLDLPLRTLLWRVMRRTLRRSLRGDEVCGGNKERIRNLFSRNSMLAYTLRIHRQNRRRIASAIAPGVPRGRVLRFTSTAQVNGWLAETPLDGRDQGLFLSAPGKTRAPNPGNS